MRGGGQGEHVMRGGDGEARGRAGVRVPACSGGHAERHMWKCGCVEASVKEADILTTCANGLATCMACTACTARAPGGRPVAECQVSRRTHVTKGSGQFDGRREKRAVAVTGCVQRGTLVVLRVRAEPPSRRTWHAHAGRRRRRRRTAVPLLKTRALSYDIDITGHASAPLLLRARTAHAPITAPRSTVHRGTVRRHIIGRCTAGAAPSSRHRGTGSNASSARHVLSSADSTDSIIQ